MSNGDHLLPRPLARGEHQDRDVGPAAQPADHLGAVHVRQAQVEDDGVRGMRGRELQAAGAGGRRVHLVAAGPQVDGERPDQVGVVVDDEHGAHGEDHHASAVAFSATARNRWTAAPGSDVA